jgi:hypothetical protein
MPLPACSCARYRQRRKGRHSRRRNLRPGSRLRDEGTWLRLHPPRGPRTSRRSKLVGSRRRQDRLHRWRHANLRPSNPATTRTLAPPVCPRSTSTMLGYCRKLGVPLGSRNQHQPLQLSAERRSQRGQARRPAPGRQRHPRPRQRVACQVHRKRLSRSGTYGRKTETAC